MLTSLNYNYRNCMVDNKQNYKFHLGVKRLRRTFTLCKVKELSRFNIILVVSK